MRTELANAGKFDDIVLKTDDNGTIRYVFGQAKHKVKAGYLVFRTLMESNNFKLSKYFDSWREILSQKQYEKSEITILIITNYQLSTAQTLQNGIVKIDSKEKSSLYFVEDKSSDLIFKEVGKRYKFPDSAAFPAERQIVFQVLKNNFVKISPSQDMSDFDIKLNSFMDRFVFVTSLEIKDIQELIQKDLKMKLNISDTSTQYLKLQNCIKNSIKNKDSAMQKLTNDEYERVFKEIELFEDKMLVIRTTKTIFDDDSRLEFQISNKTIEDFLDLQISQTNNILHVKTQALETEFVCMWIHLKLSTTADKDTYIMMKTSFGGENFGRGVKVFEVAESFKFLIIEVDSENHLFGKYNNRLTNCLQNSIKRLIAVTDVKSGVNFKNCRSLEEKVPHIYSKELSQDSLTKVLSRPVYLQNCQTTWKEITDEDYLMNKVLLKDLLATSEIGENLQISKEFDEGLYISRTFIYKNVLKSEVLTECKVDEFVYSEEDFQAKLHSNSSKNIHLLERDGKTLRWIQTSRDISNILKFIDQLKTKRPREDSMIDFSESLRISIITDVAGMGKSTLLNYLARKLKKSHPSFWVTKVDLNNFTGELSEAVTDDLETPQKAIEFLTAKIMKLESKFEKDLFRQSCESTGNVVLLFDGFDEIANYYKDQVIQLVKSLLKTKIEKFFIASRPEWSDYLVKTFSQIKHTLQPFEKEDQEHYLLNFMKKNIEGVVEVKLKKIIQTILKLMSTSISDKDYKFTGVPLILKLVGEFFVSKISEYIRASTEDFEIFIKRLEKETFNLIKLYDHFVEKKLQVYYEEKCRMILSNPQTKRTIKQLKQKILENYETLAVRQILKTDVEKYFSSIAARKLDEDELEDLVKVGLIYQIGNQWKFAHQTYAEYGFKKFLDKSFDDENCAKFIVGLVLVKPSYQVIRTFMNFWILEKVNEETCAVYQKMLLESSIEGKETPLHVAGREGNENMFCFLYSALAAKTQYFESKMSKIQDYLLKIPNKDWKSEIYPYTAFVNYFQHCEDHFNILSKVQSNFGEEFLRKILTIQMDNEEKFLRAICLSDSENILKVLNFLREFFSKDLKFLRQVLLSADEFGNSFLHRAFRYLKNKTLSKLLDELDSLKELFGQDFLNELILMKAHSFGVFLSYYAYNSNHFSNDKFLSFLNQIKFLCDQETLKKFFFFVDEDLRTFFQHYCEWAENFDMPQVLEWVARELGNEVLTELILLKNMVNQTILHEFTSPRQKTYSIFRITSSKIQSNSGSKVLSILRFLKNDLKFENDFLIEKILCSDDRHSESVFSNLFEQNQEKEFYLNFFEFLANELNGESLKNYLIQKKFLFWIAQIKEKQLRDQVFYYYNTKFEEKNFHSNESIHKICKENSGFCIEKILNYLNFIAETNDMEILKNYVSVKNSKKQTILFHFHYSILHPSASLTKMLEWLETKFKNDEKFLKNFLLEVDENSDSFLIFALKMCWKGQINDYFKETYDLLIKNFDRVFIKELLLLENNEGKNFLNIICERSKRRDQRVTQTLEILFRDFQTDQDFLAKLFNEKAKKNQEFKDFMKLKTDHPEEDVSRSKACEIS